MDTTTLLLIVIVFLLLWRRLLWPEALVLARRQVQWTLLKLGITLSV